MRNICSHTAIMDFQGCSEMTCRRELLFSLRDHHLQSRQISHLALATCCHARSVFWTDSTVVLRYVKNETNRYHTFVANRVGIIRDGCQPNQWFHVNGDNNPADDASHSLTADIFLRQTRWLTGPAFLWKHDSMWPTQDELFGEIENDDPEVKREVRAGVSSVSTPRIIYHYHYLSSLSTP